MSRQKLNNVFALVLALVLTVGLLPVQASAATADFADVSPNAWYYSNVMWARQNGIVDGVGNNRFDPDGRVANNAMVKMIVSAFFASEYAAYEAQNRNAISAYFGGNLSWDSGMDYYAKQSGLLDGVNMDIGKPASASADMSRYDMALLLANAMKRKGITVSQSGKDVAKADLMYINHYYDIPETYRDVVLTVYASGLINGKGNDGFCGGDNMTRAEACTVILRLNELVNKGGSTTTKPDPDPIVTPTPDVPSGPKDIVVTTTANATLTNIQGGPYRGTAYNIADNGFGSGYLANGKEINEANITELLEKAKTIWPNGMTWSEATTNNNWYGNPGTTINNAMRPYNLSPNAECSGFAAMISDYLFGKTGNPTHVVAKFSDLRPGDIVIRFNADKTVNHVMVVVGYYYENGVPTRVFTASGNTNDQVGWPTNTGKWYAADENSFTSYGAGSYVALSRWPESAPGTGTSKPKTPDVPTVKDIQVTTNTNASANNSGYGSTTGTSYTITDNGFGTGRLANGKEINETNITELLENAKTIWPTGMRWTDSGASNNWYANPSAIITTALSRATTGATQNINTQYGCGGFAALISDYLFGKTGNPAHVVTNFDDIRPGDIIVQMQGTTARHVMIVTGINQTGSRAGYVFCSDGNRSNAINWSKTTAAYSWGPDQLSAYGSYVAFSRWPS